MPRACTVCNHEKRKQIEKAIINGVSLRKTAKQFNVSPAAVDRHKNKCVTLVIHKVVKAVVITQEEKTAKQAEQKNILSGHHILGNLQKLTDNLDELRKKAAKDKQYSASINAVKEQIRMGENLLKRAEALIQFESDQNKTEIDYKEDLPGEIKQMVNTILNDPDIESDEVDAEYEYVSES